MFSYLYDFVISLFTNNEVDTDEDKEIFLAEQLFELDTQARNEDCTDRIDCDEVPNEANCFQRSGLITYKTENYILIDDNMYFDTSSCSLSLNVNDKIVYLGYKDSNDAVIVVRILENQGMYWGDENIDSEELNFNVIEHILIGQVSERRDRFVYIMESDMKFNLDDVEGKFIPIEGDWLDMKCMIQQNSEKLSNISTNQVIKVITFKPLRTKVTTAIVTEWDGKHGTCDRHIYFSNEFLISAVNLKIGSKVMVEAIESNQGRCNWRAINIVLSEIQPQNNGVTEQIDVEHVSLEVEKQHCIEMTYPIKFEHIKMNQKDKVVLSITNRSNEIHTLNKWVILSKKRDSQVTITPFITSPIRLASGDTFKFTITCHPKFFGHTKEHLIFLFRGFQLKRIIEINVIDDCKIKNNSIHLNVLTRAETIEKMKRIREDSTSVVPGIKTCRTPNFIAVRIGQFPIPEKYWDIVLGDSNETVYSNDYNNILTRIDAKLPYLSQEKAIHNYSDIWHALLYMEEIQVNLNMRVHDKPKAYLIQYQEYLGIEIKGLAEKRPSLIKGDRVILKDIWNPSQPHYEGYIHVIKGNLILVKFCQNFHENYGGSDVSLEFQLNRTVYRRSHYAINLAVSNLGPDILFPSRLSLKNLQVPEEKLQNIKWFNKKVNSDQQRAIVNILKGECRPMPYVIFGPPGTGKSITVVETILQILNLIPDSRVLVATPSNSASNLLTERLIEYTNLNLGSIVRIIAHHLVESDNIPEKIKPFCATVDISSENSAKSQHTVKDSINLQCSQTYIGRHRVTIGTCYALGVLKYWALPRGHFTHVIVDEAGQSTEPEIMLPLTFINKEQGQIILAGDPMQLGPVVMSKYCTEYGLGESYLSRLLERYPYQKDKHAFSHNYDDRLITKLNENYRSLEEVLELPSSIFYDGSLNANYTKRNPETTRYMEAVSSIFQLPNRDDGCGVFVYGIKGCNARAEESPSWYNPQEASMVALTTCKLFKNNIDLDEIGIITPYIAQTRYLGLIFDSMGLPRPKIGTVEDFQGQERPIILISTVRSTESLVNTDLKHALGFLQHPKRVNVALTRAQVAVIIFCNPHLLSKDSLWSEVINYAVSNDKYTGCDFSNITHETDLIPTI